MDTKLVSILVNIFNVRPEEVKDSLQKEDVLNWDSLTHMDLISSIEREYNIELSMEDILEMTSVANIKEILQKHKVSCDA